MQPGRQATIVSQITSVPVPSDTRGQGHKLTEDGLLSGQEGDTSRREYGPPVLHSDGIHDLKWGPKIYETCHRIEKELKKINKKSSCYA